MQDFPPSSSQLGYIADLANWANVSRLSLGDIHTKADAAKAIDRLLTMIPLRHKTRQAIFASMGVDNRWDHDSLCEELEIESFAAGNGATESHGQRALKLIHGPLVRRRQPSREEDYAYSTPVEPPSFVAGLVEMETEQLAQWAASQPNGDRIISPDAPIIVTPAPNPRRGRPGVSPSKPVDTPAPLPVVPSRPGRPGVPKRMGDMNPLIAAVLERFPGAVVVAERREERACV